MGTICQCRSRTLQDAALPHAPETLSRTVSVLELLYWVSPYLVAAFWTGPNELKGPFDSNGYPVGCKSDCEVDRNPTNSPSCCSGSHNTPQTCPSSGVPHYSYFSASFRFRRVDLLCNRSIVFTESGCPNSYVYAYDESSGTALWTCSASSKAAYTITFCP